MLQDNATLLKKALAQVFSYEFCEIFQNSFFHRTRPVAASEEKSIYANWKSVKKQLSEVQKFPEKRT